MRLPKDRVHRVAGPTALLTADFPPVASLLFYVVPSGVRSIGQPKVELHVTWRDTTIIGTNSGCLAWGLYVSTAADATPASPQSNPTDYLLWGTGLIHNPYSYFPGGEPPTEETPFREPSLTIRDESQAQRLVVPGHRLFLSVQIFDLITNEGDGVVYGSVNFLAYGNAP